MYDLCHETNGSPFHVFDTFMEYQVSGIMKDTPVVTINGDRLRM